MRGLLALLGLTLLPSQADALTLWPHAPGSVANAVGNTGVDVEIVEAHPQGATPVVGAISTTIEGVRATTSWSISDEAILLSGDSSLDALPGTTSAYTFAAIHFTLEAPMAYAIDAFFEVASADPATSNMLVGLEGGAVLDRYAANQTGHDLLTYAGSGVLEPNTLYIFAFHAILERTDPLIGSGRSQGRLSFTPIPEPSTAALVAFGLVGMAAMRLRRGGRDTRESPFQDSRSDQVAATSPGAA